MGRKHIKKIMKKILKNKNILSYLIIFFVSIFLSIPLFSKYMNITIDDGIQHIYRLVGTNNSIIECFKNGNIFPVIISNFCNEFGYSWNIFYSPLTAYIPLIFKIFTNSYILSLKIYIWLSVFLSGIFMQKLVKNISKSDIASVISAIIYMSAPYHLTDIYTRMAVAEISVFVFLPMLFIGLHNLMHKKQKYGFYIVISASFLILSHNILSLYTAIFSAIYILCNYKVLKNKETLKTILISIILILLCTSFYWIPLLEHRFATEYEVFVENRMYNDNTLISTQLNLKELIYLEHNNFKLYIGLPIIIGVIITLFYINKLKKPLKKEVLVYIMLGIISIFMVSTYSPIIHFPNTLKMIQFVWRLMTYVTFFLSIVAGIGLSKFINHKFIKETLVIVLISGYVIFVTINNYNNTENIIKDEEFLTPVEVVPETGRVHAGLASFEYLPKKAFRNRSYIEKRSKEALCILGQVDIINSTKDGTNMSFNIENAKNCSIELPYIYYLGYDTQLESNNTITKLSIEESDKGFLLVKLDNVKQGTITVSYKGTTLMKASYVLSLIGIGLLVFYIYKCRKKLTNNYK